MTASTADATWAAAAGPRPGGPAPDSAKAPTRAPAPESAFPRWTPLRDALHAEWTKLRTLSGTYWLLAGLVLATVALSLLASATVTCSTTGCTPDPVRVSLTGVEFGQAAAAVLATLAVGGEYATGMVRVTFAAMPNRLIVLAAKAVVVSVLVSGAGIVAVAGSLAAGLLLLPGDGFTAAHGFATFSATDASVVRAAAGSVLYFVLIALLSLGLAAAARDSAVAVGLVLGLLYLFPIVIAVVAEPHWHRRLQQLSPMNAGLAVQDAFGSAGPLSPWAGLGVLACWAGGALVLGGAALRLRDA